MEFICTVTDEEMDRWSRGTDRLTISGIFSGGVYLLRADGRMLLLHDREYGAVPFGLQTEGILGRGRELGFDADEPLVLKNGSILQQGTGIRLRLRYAPPGPLQPALPPDEACVFLRAEGVRLLSGEKRSALLPFAENDVGSISKADLADPFAAAGLKGMQLLEKGIAEADEALIGEGLQGTIGLGQGLTPSFDDFITGALLALNYAAAAWDCRHPALGAMQKRVTELAPLRTNPYSAAYLTAAAEGGRFSLAEDFLNAAGTDGWPLCARRLLRVGSASGADMAAGILFAVRLLQGSFCYDRA